MSFQNNHLLRSSLLTTLLILSGQPATATAADPDQRQLVEMPAASVVIMRADMRDHLLALDEVIRLLAAGKTEQAGTVVRSRLGSGAMGRHRGDPNAPGLHMTPAMRSLGRSLHTAADALADAILVDDLPGVLAALQGVTANCSACHSAFRVR